MENLNIGMNDILGRIYSKFSQPEPFDWYQIYTGIKDVITQHITKTNKILNIGAGNSSKIKKLK